MRHQSPYGLVLPTEIENYFNNLNLDELMEHSAAISQMALEERQHQLNQSKQIKIKEDRKERSFFRLFSAKYG